MIGRSVGMLLREVTVLVTALALIVAGSLVTRAHVLARAGLPGEAVVICHGDPDTAPATADLPDTQRNSHLCNQCVGCQAALAVVALPAFGPHPGWHLASTPLVSPGQLTATRPDLPPATGPPHLG
jgi:hypothetical protein